MNIFKLVIALFLVTITGCEKDDKKDDTACLKDENFFEANFMDETLEPYFSSGISGRYTLFYLNCFNDDSNSYVNINTKNDMSLFIYFINIDGVGNYSINSGIEDTVPGQCPVSTSIFLMDDNTASYTFISNNIGAIEVTEYDVDLGIVVGTFSAEMVSTIDPNEVFTMTGTFNINKSTLVSTEKPCFID